MFEVRQTAAFSLWLAALLRIDVGPGYRLYYMRAGEAVYVMLGGGDKSTQATDIKRATAMANELKAATKASKPRKPK